MRVDSHPASASGLENPKPGSDGATTWNAGPSDGSTSGSIGRVAAVGSWVGQRTDQIHELGDRAGVSVGDDQRQGVRFGGSDVQEVDPLSVDRGGELGERVEPRLVGSPVVVAEGGKGVLVNAGDLVAA